MATIYHEFEINASAAFTWEAIKDTGAVHKLAKGFVTRTELNGSERTVTFANGFVVKERIVGIVEEARRLSYSAIGGRASHHNAYFQVFATGEESCRVLWVTDLLPDEMEQPIRQMVEQGAKAIKSSLESAYSALK